MPKFTHFIPPVAVVALLLAVGAADDKKPDSAKLPPAAEGKIDFDTDIKPILAAHCVKCHGPTRQKGGLRLDTGTHAKEGGNSGAVILAGKSADSTLIHAVAGIEPASPMPPGEGKRLSA